MLAIESGDHPYRVEEYGSLGEAAASVAEEGTFVLVDQFIFDHYGEQIGKTNGKCLPLVATEEQKSFEKLAPVFVRLLENGMKRDGRLLVIGGGILQDIGCFIASVLFRGVRWEFIPTTLLAQCDSCIGSKSSINIGSYKNQIGTFYAPERVLLATDVLRTLPWDEVRSGLGEVIKLHLIAGEEAFCRIMKLLPNARTDGAVLPECIRSSLEIKKPYIEKDEHDTGVRNLLNYGHTFGHAYESATHYAIPHGIAVTLGVLTATYVSAQMGMVSEDYFQNLKAALAVWHRPYEQKLKELPIEAVLAAIKLDKKNTKQGLHCILTRGAGRMEKIRLGAEIDLGKLISRAIQIF
ncbi:MAG TPA: AroB-related putative sugar phosphate phospholyase (cyclizing) [Candidatus Methylacidiphilales bacterium]|jgi:3-dehydroquinate synthase|nr:AroB-related putative sugar phosphate phospholyase (cyclizing) [Candidatus Methylacidiphilales bacterium]